MFGAVVRDTPSTLMWPLSVSATPASSRPIPAVLGMEPTQTRQWLPVTLEPSPRVTTTPSSVRSTVSARERDSTFTPRRSKTSSSTSAASVSEPGRTRSRLEIRVTFEPRPL